MKIIFAVGLIVLMLAGDGTASATTQTVRFTFTPFAPPPGLTPSAYMVQGATLSLDGLNGKLRINLRGSASTTYTVVVITSFETITVGTFTTNQQGAESFSANVAFTHTGQVDISIWLYVGSLPRYISDIRTVTLG